MTVFTASGGLTETLDAVLWPAAIGRGVTGKLALLLVATRAAT